MKIIMYRKSRDTVVSCAKSRVNNKTLPYKVTCISLNNLLEDS